MGAKGKVVAHFKRLCEDDLHPADQVGKAALQREAGRQARSAQSRHQGGDVHPQLGHCADSGHHQYNSLYQRTYKTGYKGVHFSLGNGPFGQLRGKFGQQPSP